METVTNGIVVQVTATMGSGEPEESHSDVRVPIVHTRGTLGIAMLAIAAGGALSCADHGAGVTGGARGRAARLRS